MARVIHVYWRDIPMRVMVRDGRRRIQRGLDARFETAMERAALREGKGQSHAMLDDWRREEYLLDGEPEQLLESAAARLEAAYDADQLKVLVGCCGWNRPVTGGATP